MRDFDGKVFIETVIDYIRPVFQMIMRQYNFNSNKLFTWSDGAPYRTARRNIF